MNLSARAFHRILKIGRTIADLQEVRDPIRTFGRSIAISPEVDVLTHFDLGLPDFDGIEVTCHFRE